MLGPSLHFLHQPRALDDVTEAGIIFDIGRDGKLPAGLQSLHDDGRQPGARAIDGGGKPGRAGAKDQHASGMSGGHGVFRLVLKSIRSRREIRIRSEEHTSELQSLMRLSYAVLCWKKKNIHS